ncbi:glycosyltransferase [bacterium]|nr:glycosyltransferase [bacterium]
MTPSSKKPITVGFVLGTLGVGGAEGQVIRLAERLPEYGFRPILVIMEERGPYLETVRDMGMPLHCTHSVMTYRKYDPRFTYHFARTAWRMRQAFNAERVDIIHAFLYWAYIFAALASPFSRNKVLITSRRSRGIFKEGRFGYQAIENLTNHWIDAATVNSLGLYDDALGREKIDRKRMAVIYNGVDIEGFDAVEHANLRTEFPELSDAEPLVGAVGNLKRIKGYPDLLEAVAMARREVPKLKLVVLGFDNENLREELEQQVRSLGLEGAVVFAGGRKQVWPYYFAFDILAHPAHSEGFANVLLEAMAAGRPIVATDVGGNKESVSDGETGYIVPPQKPVKMAAKLVQLAKDPALANRMGKEGRRRVEARFSVDAMVKAHVRMYEALLETGKLPPMQNPPILTAEDGQS